MNVFNGKKLKIEDKTMAAIQLTTQQLRKLQLTELELLIEADRICRKCGIHYNIIAGTLLGAVRHGGFIPWDDDADIALLRSEYEKFRKACETELNHEKYYFQDNTNTPGYRWGYGKLRKKDTFFIRAGQEHMPYEQGVFIDVFPLDCVSNKRIGRAINNFHCFCIRKFLWSEAGKISEKNLLKRKTYQLMSKLPLELIFRHYQRYVKKCEKKNSQWVRILTFPTPNNEYGYKKKWYEKSREITFENIKFQGIEDWNDYLTFKFGDYMQLPPNEHRKVHPVSEIKL